MMSSAYSGSVMEPEAMMGHVDAADAALFQFLGQIDRIFNAEAVRFIVGAAEADGNGVVRSDLSTYILEDLEVNAGAVFQRAAVHVGTMVGGGGEELVSKYPWAPWSSTSSKPAFLARSAASPKHLTIS